MGQALKGLAQTFSPEGFRSEFGSLFTTKGMEQYGELIGKAALSGLSIGGAIAGTLVGGPLGAAATIPGAIKSTIGFVGSIVDLAKKRRMDADLNETANKVLSSDFGQVLNGIDAASSFLGATKALPEALQNLSNIVNRGSGITSIGQIARIIGPTRQATQLSGPISNAARTATSLASIPSSVFRAASDISSIATTEERPRQQPRPGGGIMAPGSLLPDPSGIIRPPTMTIQPIK